MILPTAHRKRLENLEHARAVRSVRPFSGAPLRGSTPQRAMRIVWVLLGHYRRKPSDMLGVYRTYTRGKAALDAAGFIGAHHKVELTRMEVKG